MGVWDELCLICGLSPGGGPRSLFAEGALERCLNTIMESLSNQIPFLDISEDQLRGELREILLLFQSDDYDIPTPYEGAVKSGSISSVPYFPFRSEEWDGWKAIAIGVFDDSLSDPNGLAALSPGYAATTRLVCYPTGQGGTFVGIEGQDSGIRTDAGLDSENIFCLRAPYHYLQSWVDRDSLPPRQTAFPLEPDMSFEGELYEIVHFWEARGRDRYGISYGGIERCLEQFQDHFSTGFKGTFELDRALESGMRGNDLIPALLNDFNVWQTCPPDRWVKADLSILSSTYSPVSNGTATSGPLGVLPDEIIFEILLDIPIESILSFTSTCKFLRRHFGSPFFLSRLLRTRLRRPLDEFHWFLPVSTMEGEVDKFYAACNDSKPPQAESAKSNPTDVSALLNADFPLMEFFRTNYRTDSMKNRRRLWKISQQFREEWYRYRVGENEQFKEWRKLNVGSRW